MNEEIKNWLIMWPVNIYRQVNKYLDDYIKSHRSVVELQKAIIEIFYRNDGLPTQGQITAYEDGWFVWIIYHHTLLLRQIPGQADTTITEVVYVIDSEVRGQEGIELLKSLT